MDKNVFCKKKSLTKGGKRSTKISMADVAQLVRARGCGPRGRRFETGHSPQILFLFSLDNCFFTLQNIADILAVCP